MFILSCLECIYYLRNDLLLHLYMCLSVFKINLTINLTKMQHDINKKIFFKNSVGIAE